MTKLIMMVGLVGSGKSTYAEKLALQENAIIHSSDKLREEMFGSVDENSKNDELFITLHRRIKNDLIEGKNVIFDATNISYKRRMAFLNELKKIDCTKICYMIATTYEKCLEQNKNRERKVPEHVIKKMYLNFDVPAYFEGWDQIAIISDDKSESHEDLFTRLDTINQDNPHHIFTIGMHCKSTAAHLCNDIINGVAYNDINLITAALYHDIGKEFTKSFENSKREVTDIAHYYQHHHVSAYSVIFLLFSKSVTDILDVCQLIRWHMQPFFMDSDKARDKFIKLVGQEFYDRLMMLHEADRKAH